MSHARYIEGVGRRKTAIARVRLVGGHGKFGVNGKDSEQYFATKRLRELVLSPLTILKVVDKFDGSVKVSGGGINAQAEAVRLGISRALAENNPDFGVRLHKLGLLTRDARMVERKKYGLKKARRAPQWAKR
ncbi:MAG: 30S ribosomal protein S9 [Patescibacteria group bacterium]|nr:30S ribosomal protein S9 [Patescibacteria group bacterium]MDE2014939.1 30S ribosomal protein S9 [Patescibacteria group bacterium]MDE2226368.1 30S ribosomal protein S9 [Patescibacteria group bacterium]